MSYNTHSTSNETTKVAESTKVNKSTKVAIILLNGDEGIGKTTIANYLVSHYGFNKFSFATQPKKDLAMKLNFDVNLWNDRKFKEENRQKLIEYAESLKEIHGRGVWAEYVKKDICNLRDQVNDDILCVVIDDYRFRSEIEVLRNFDNKYDVLLFEVDIRHSLFDITPNSILYLRTRSMVLNVSSVTNKESLDSVIAEEVKHIISSFERVVKGTWDYSPHILDY